MPDSTNIIAYQTADLAAGTISPEQITCTQYDRQAKLIAVRLKENGKDWTIPTGYRANVRMRKADGVYVYNTCTTEGNIAYITLTEQMCGVVGEQIYVLEVINGDHAVQSVTGRLKVIQNPIDDEDADFTSTPEYTTIQTAVADAQQAAQDAADASQKVVDESMADYLKKSGGDMTGDVNMAYGTGIKAKPDSSKGGTSLLDIGNNTGYSTTIRFLTGRSSTENNHVAFAIRDNMQGGGVRTKLDCYENIITNLADPTDETDATNKRYVDKLKKDCAAAYAPISAAIRPTVSGNPILVQDSVAWPLQSLVLHGKTTQDGTPSPDNPVPLVSAGDEGQIDVTVCGANILFVNIKKPTGMEVECDENGIITITGAPGEDRDVRIIGDWANKEEIYPNGDKIVYLEGLTEDETIYIRTTNNTTGYKGGKEIKILSAILGIIVRLKDGKTYNGLQIKPMINFGSTALPFEPYTGKTITISTPNGLPGIPVDSGGNYTDSTRQQWICDEIDAEENKYIKRTFLQTLDENLNYTLNSTNNENLYQYVTYLTTSMDGTNSKALLSDRFAPGAQLGSSTKDPGLWIYGPNTLVIVVQKNIASTADELKQWSAANPTTVLLPLAEPEVSTITADQVNSYGGATTAYTTSGADLTMQYVADAQKYIDNKIGAISAAMLEE